MGDPERKKMHKGPGNVPQLWKPGQSGNPGGRPKSFASKIRDETKGLEKQIQRMIEFSLGMHGATVQNQIDATKWIADRSHGKAVETSVMVEADARELEEPLQIATESLEALARAISEPIALVPDLDPDPDQKP